jgi:hypothetical protein
MIYQHLLAYQDKLKLYKEYLIENMWLASTQIERQQQPWQWQVVAKKVLRR